MTSLLDTKQRAGAGRVHPLSVGKVVDASEDAPKVRQVAAPGARPARWKSLLTVDLAHWIQTIQDRRFYQKMELEFSVIDQYFRNRGFEFSKGMSLKPSRRVLSRFQALSGCFHPVEKIHVVAPGDPIFHIGGLPSAVEAASRGGSGLWTESTSRPSFPAAKAPSGAWELHGRAAVSASNNATGGASTSELADLDLGRIRQPRLIITSMRLLVFQGEHWASHFYADMVDELPSILSWSEERGWRRALDNDNAQYYRRVRYISVDRKRKSIPCTDTNSAALVSWLVQLVGERNAEEQRLQRSRYPFPWARAYLERDASVRHLDIISKLGLPDTKALIARAVARPGATAPAPAPAPATAV